MNQPVNTELIEKIPFFHGLSHYQVQQVLRTGELKTRRQGEFLFKDEDKSMDAACMMVSTSACERMTGSLFFLRAFGIRLASHVFPSVTSVRSFSA